MGSCCGRPSTSKQTNIPKGSVISETFVENHLPKSSGKLIISASRDGSIKLLDLETQRLHHHFRHAHKSNHLGEEYRNILNAVDWINTITITPNGRYIVSGSKDNSIKVFDIETKQEFFHFRDAHQCTKKLTLTVS